MDQQTTNQRRVTAMGCQIEGVERRPENSVVWNGGAIHCLMPGLVRQSQLGETSGCRGETVLSPAILNEIEGGRRSDAANPLRKSSSSMRQRTSNACAQGSQTNHARICARSGAPNHARNISRSGKQNNANHKSECIGTLNIKGKLTQNRQSKYKLLSEMMRMNKIAILAVQETHLNEEEAKLIEINNPRIKIINNGHYTNKLGVAFVLNQDYTKNVEYKHEVIIKDRASRLQIKIRDMELDMINIYMPNTTKAKQNTIKEIQNKIQNTTSERSIILGDFNLVEDSLDRYPSHKDNDKTVGMLSEMLKTNKMVDIWREMNKDERDFTFTQAGTNSLARIDRIYVHENAKENMNNPQIQNAAKLSDHKMATIEITKTKTKNDGPGLWRLSNGLLKHEKFTEKARDILLQLEKDIEQYKKRENKLKHKREMKEIRKSNPQTLYNKAKQRITKLAIKISQQNGKAARLYKEGLIKDLKNAKKNLKDNERDEEALTNIILLENKLDELKYNQTKKSKDNAKARYKEKGEKCTKYWFDLTKPKHTKESIAELQDEQGKITNDSRKMAIIATEHHKMLQAKPETEANRKQEIKDVLNAIEKEINETEWIQLNEGVSQEEVSEALKNSKNGKAPGADGLTYEFWKEMNKTVTRKNKKENAINALFKVIQDIEKHGIYDENFTKGIMYPLYKKKDRRKIENYRPITLLNTDYKIYTKTLATRLGKVCPRIIHPDQAGFVPGRSIYDHTSLTTTIIELAELEGINGCILSLDQEKAYDKIAHDYLYKVLKKFKFPTSFIRKIRELYKNATTAVNLNGVIPEHFKIERGVRQGDPMSCLLYDLAIEPLAQMLRDSTLKGIKIPYKNTKLIATLFADDTIVYLNEQDNLNKVWKTIDKFCKASTAKFNKDKTEVLPIGTKEYRQKLITTRKLNNKRNNKFEETIRIIPEGTAMRTLGAWVGNKAEPTTKWNEIVLKQKETIKKWETMHTSLRGKELILKALVTSQGWYLATVNEMPKYIEKELEKEMRNFTWDNKKKGYITWNLATTSREQGGLNMPNIKARLDAIALMRAKRWLTPPEENRPDWAYIVDKILTHHVPQQPKVDPTIAREWALQSWKATERNNRKMHPFLKRMISTLQKYNYKVDGLKIDKITKQQFPVWYHIRTTGNYTYNKKAANCVRQNHGVYTLMQLQNNHNEYPSLCSNPTACERIKEPLMKWIPEKWNPEMTSPQKDGLDLTPQRLKEMAEKDVKTDTITFNPNVTEKGHPYSLIRVCGNKPPKPQEERKPAYRAENNIIKRNIKLYTDGSALPDGKSGAGIWHKHNSTLNRALRLEGTKRTNQEAELVAVIAALELVPNDNVTIISDSRYVIDGLTQHIKKWEDNGWIETANSQLWRKLVEKLRRRTGTTNLKWVKGHANNYGNNKADELANKGANKEKADKINLTLDEQWTLDGARLITLTQKIAYKHTNNLQKKQEHNINTKMRLEDAQDEILRVCGYRPTTQQIWKSLKKEPIRPKIRDFIWLIITNRLRCGTYFRNIPKWEEKQFCECGELETPEHIILNCEKRPVKELWSYVKDLWIKSKQNNNKENEWIEPSIGIVRGLGTIQIKNNKGHIAPTMTHKYKVMISEAIWLIWKLRCESIFQERKITIEEYKAQYASILRDTIKLEKLIQKMKENPTQREQGEKRIQKTWGGNNILIGTLEDGNPIKLQYRKQDLKNKQAPYNIAV